MSVKLDVKMVYSHEFQPDFGRLKFEVSQLSSLTDSTCGILPNGKVTLLTSRVVLSR